MTRVDLPDGGWAELADPNAVTQAQRKPVRRAMYTLVMYRTAKAEGDIEDPLGEQELALLETFSEALMLALITAWSYTQPVNADGLGELPGPVFDALQLECAPLGKELLPSFEPDQDPKGPPTSTDSSKSSLPLEPVNSISPMSMPVPMC